MQTPSALVVNVFFILKVKVKVIITWICIAPCRDNTSKALRYGMRSQGISQFYLHTRRTSTDRNNTT